MTGKLHDKLVLFGAGKIGRSFIGPLFSRGGFEVVFIDISKPVIDELNLRHSYCVLIRSDVETVINVQHVRGVFVGDEDQVIREIVTARILAVSVGSNELGSILPVIAKGLLKRFETAGTSPLDIIIAENLRNAGEFMRQELKNYLPEGYPLEERVGLVETSIGKMVPIMLMKDTEEDLLQVFAEPYNTLILDKRAFKNPIPEIEGFAPKENMKAWVDQKLFIHNLGHAAAVYLGYLAHPDAIYLHEVLSDSKLKEEVRNTMLQAADILLNTYPGEFTAESLTAHIDDLIRRFQNKALGDTLFRVGCDLKRKLSSDDRLACPIRLARELNLPYGLILKVLVCGCHFRATDEAGNRLSADLEFDEIYEKGIREVLTAICGFDEVIHREVIAEAIKLDDIVNLIREGKM